MTIGELADRIHISVRIRVSGIEYIRKKRKIGYNCWNMTDQNIPKRHHYIPQFYLKGFSTDKEHLYVLDKLAEGDKKIRYQTTESIAFQNNLYTFRVKANRKETLEGVFAQLEGIAAEIIRKIENKRELSSQDRNDLALFISFLWIRVPKSKKEFEKTTKELYEKTARMSMRMRPKESIRKFLQDKGKKMTDKEIEDLINFATNEKRSKIRVDVPQEYWIKQMLTMGMEISPALEIANWEFKIAEKPFAFITSDNPFLLMPSRPIDFDGLGLLTPGAKKIIPITSKICLVIHEPQKDPKAVYTTIDRDLIRKINDWIVKYSERCVYSPDKGKIEKIAKTKKELLEPVAPRFKVS